MTEEEAAADWATAECTENAPMQPLSKPEIQEVPECTGCEETPEGCDSMPQEFADEPVRPGIGLQFVAEQNMIVIGVITGGGNAHLGFSVDEAIAFRDNLNAVIEQAQASQNVEQ